MTSEQGFDVAVIGAGVFGAWTSYKLIRGGAKVVLLDAYGPGNSLASSGGESRIIRMGYGADLIYTQMAQRSLIQWKELLGSSGLFQPTGVLWLAREKDEYCEAVFETLTRSNVPCERLTREQLGRRYPQLEFGEVAWGILESDSGVLLARRAVQAVVERVQQSGGTYLAAQALPLEGMTNQERVTARRNSLETAGGQKIHADAFVFACGPWLPKLFPVLLADLIHVTRQEVFFFGTLAGDDWFGPDKMPAWIDFNDLIYGLPSLYNRGVKIAIDEHGPEFNPDNGERIVSSESAAAVRRFLGRRIPKLANAPVVETRVCQYENTSNGDFLIDRHPAFENVWLAGGGSGHGFKHGPAVGEHVAALLAGKATVEPRFSLQTKEKVQQRKVY